MKDFIKKILLFIISLTSFIFCLVLSLSLTHEFDQNLYSKSEFKNAFIKGDSKVIILGNSKAQDAVDSVVLKKELDLSSFNLASSSANISISRLTLESYLKNCETQPELVLLEVSWFTFDKKRTSFNVLGADLFLRELSLFKYFWRYSPQIQNSIRKKIFNNLFSFSKNTNQKKDFLVASPKTKDYIFDREIYDLMFPNKIAEIDNLLLEDYYSIIEICNKKNIQLILFTSPEDEDYSRAQLNRKEIKKIFNDSKNKFDDLIYLDYSYEGDLWKKDYEFWLKDSHHIRYRDLFTKILSNDIKNETDLILR
jgi:hypothetical protein